jgi:phage shock protein A
MGILNKIITAIRGGAREAGESIVDANSIRIFEQEIHDAQNNLQQAKQNLTTVMAQEIQASRKIESLEQNITTNKDYATQALTKNDESLALEVAEKIALLQQELSQQQQIQQSYNAHVAKLKGLIKKTANSLADMQRQLIMVKTTDSVQKAASAITENSASSGSKLLSAKESLDRIQKRQQLLDDKLQAGSMLDGDMGQTSLDDKLKAAGIGQTTTSAQDVLAQIKAAQ